MHLYVSNLVGKKDWEKLIYAMIFRNWKKEKTHILHSDLLRSTHRCSNFPCRNRLQSLLCAWVSSSCSISPCSKHMALKRLLFSKLLAILPEMCQLLFYWIVEVRVRGQYHHMAQQKLTLCETSPLKLEHIFALRGCWLPFTYYNNTQNYKKGKV